MRISDQIRVLCARLNISIAELARRLGKSPQSLHAMLKRESLTAAELEKIASVINTTFLRQFVLPNGERI